MLRIVVNGEAKTVAPETTVAQLLVELGLGDVLVAVERNEEIVPRGQHQATELADGDRLVHFVGGG